MTANYGNRALYIGKKSQRKGRRERSGRRRTKRHCARHWNHPSAQIVWDPAFAGGSQVVPATPCFHLWSARLQPTLICDFRAVPALCRPCAALCGTLAWEAPVSGLGSLVWEAWGMNPGSFSCSLLLYRCSYRRGEFNGLPESRRNCVPLAVYFSVSKLINTIGVFKLGFPIWHPSIAVLCRSLVAVSAPPPCSHLLSARLQLTLIPARG